MDYAFFEELSTSQAQVDLDRFLELGSREVHVLQWIGSQIRLGVLRPPSDLPEMGP